MPPLSLLSLGLALTPLFSGSSALAESLTWVGADSGSWLVDTNWDPIQLPTTDDTLTILGPGNTAGDLTIGVSAAAAGGSINFTNTSATSMLNATSGANQTLTLGSASANGITTGSGAVTIGSSTANQNVNVALGANQTWDVGSGGMSVINVISGGFSLTKNGSGALSLNGSNTFSGGLAINAGTVNANASGALGAGAVTLDSGGRLDLFASPTGLTGVTFNGGEVNARGGSRTIVSSVTIGGDFTLNSASAGGNSLTLSGAVNLGGGTRNVTVDSGGAVAISGVISNGGLTKSGTGQMNLSNSSNSYTGVTIQNGALRVSNNGALGAGSAEISLGDATSISGNFSPTLKVNSATIISRNITVGASNAATTGTYTIDSDNVGSAWGLSGTTTLNQSLTVSNGSTGGVTLSGSISSGSSGTQMLTLNNTPTAFTANITVSGDIGGGAGTIAVTKTGAGYVRFTTANTYTGDTRIGAGILQLDTAGTNFSLQNSTVDMNASDTGALEFRGSTGTVGAVFGGLKGSRNLSLQNTSGNAVALTVGGNNQSTTYSGALTGSGSVTKTGGGTLTLSGTNTNTGATTIREGALAISGSLGSTAVTVGGNGASGTPTLSGDGVISGATVIASAGTGAAGTHSVGVAGVNDGVGTQTFSSTLEYQSGSIFAWTLQAASTTDPGAVSDTATGSYDKVVANGSSGSVTGSDAIFEIVLGGNNFADAFWDTAKSWTNVFSGSGAPADLGSIFSSFGGADVASDGTVVGQGQFGFSGSTLTWSAVPEPTSALAGLLLATGLMRRQRRAYPVSSVDSTASGPHGD